MSYAKWLMGDLHQRLPASLSLSSMSTWEKTIESVAKSVVSIHFYHPHNFDTVEASASQATGFVVDIEKGYVLTNRHVVGPGPFRGFMVLCNHQEVEVKPVYRDPVHDFGFLQFDPSALKNMDLRALELRPDLAKVNAEIRLLGNDAGEKMSILSGYISRVDRNTPEYDSGYFDFNTCYYQASASAVGGSSGSPVINADGYAVALAAGGATDASTDYFLPLDLPSKALRCLQRGCPVARGDIQCLFQLKPFDQCKRLGLTVEAEAVVRKSFPENDNMLVAQRVLPQGPCHLQVEEGDILLEVNGALVIDFIKLEDVLDSHVGKVIHLRIQRSGADMSVDVQVGDLHDITPDRFVSYSGFTFHPLSYQQAQRYGIACRGVFAAPCWKDFGSSLIHSVDNIETPNLSKFIEVVEGIADRITVTLAYRELHNLESVITTTFTVDRHWYPEMEMRIRNDLTGEWDVEPRAEPIEYPSPPPRAVSFMEITGINRGIARVAKSFVRVECAIAPTPALDHTEVDDFWGMGLVIDANLGLVVVSRAVVPHAACDASIVVAESVTVRSEVVFLHPSQNFTILRYDPNLILGSIETAVLSDECPLQGDPVYFLGYNHQKKVVYAATNIISVHAATLCSTTRTPTYRATNTNVINIDTPLGQACGSGVLVSDNGVVQALWLTYLGKDSSYIAESTRHHFGLPLAAVQQALAQIRAEGSTRLRILPAEFGQIELAEARDRGLTDELFREDVEGNLTDRHHFFVCTQLFENAETESLRVGDILLMLDDRPTKSMSDLNISFDDENVDAVVVRDRQVTEVVIATLAAKDIETHRVIRFCGAYLQAPHLAVRQQRGKLHGDVYVSGICPGSPSHQYELYGGKVITHVDTKATPTLDDFLGAVQRLPNQRCMAASVLRFVSKLTPARLSVESR
ncbi:hypothetical protein Brms1b_013326 [Colletotrichum noveboracense]|nr:hypothetical protein Brms1b_013326 [Colletotrichum noveboracense]